MTKENISGENNKISARALRKWTSSNQMNSSCQHRFENNCLVSDGRVPFFIRDGSSNSRYSWVRNCDSYLKLNDDSEVVHPLNCSSHGFGSASWALPKNYVDNGEWMDSLKAIVQEGLMQRWFFTKMTIVLSFLLFFWAKFSICHAVNKAQQQGINTLRMDGKM